MKAVSKSYRQENPLLDYCLSNSTPSHPVQTKLMQDTLKIPRSMMLGAPEVLNLNSLLIKAIGGKKVIDVGVFTGASSLAAALAIPEDGKVLACDTSVEWTNMAKNYWKEAKVDHKVHLILAPAVDTLKDALAKGEEGTFDFAFIDADKVNYDNYYELVLQLLRPKGMMTLDNTLWGGNVLNDSDTSESTMALKALNIKIGKDPRVTCTLMNVGDGLTVITKH